MSIKMIRIDDRLIHGQVVAAWSKSIKFDRIWIVDDGVNNDEFIKDVMKLVAPPDMELIVSSTLEIESLTKEFDNDQIGTLVLAKFPWVVQKIFDSGVKLNQLNIGGIGANKDRKKLFKNISASESEVETLKEIKKNGVKIYFQVTPNEKQTLFE